MRIIIAHLIAAIFLVFFSSPASAQNRITATLTSEQSQPVPGQTIRLALRMAPQPGWHGYWENPGESGMATTIDWTLPKGVTISRFRHPAPTAMVTGGLVSFIQPDVYTLVAEMRVASSVPVGQELPIKGNLRYATCSDSMCISERAVLTLDLVAGNTPNTPASIIAFNRIENLLPSQLGTTGKLIKTADGIEVRVRAPGVSPDRAALFASDNDLISPSATQKVRRDGNELVFSIAGTYSDLPRKISGVITTGPGTRGATFTAVKSEPAAKPTVPATSEISQGGVNVSGSPVGDIDAETLQAVAPAEEAATTSSVLEAPESNASEAQSTNTFAIAADALPTAGIGLLPALLGALIGGLLLNLMPCVFPILSLKALSLAKSGQSQAVARQEAIAYSAGTMLACLALGGTLLALRGMGSEIGWAFQLQQPGMVMALAVLTAAIGLNMLDAFQLPAVTTGSNLAAKSGSAGAFWTGILSAVVATPCSGPFMGLALGSALVLPPLAALAVFAGLGLGLALPFLAIGLIPALRTRLPKPGQWMVTLRHALAVPMFLTAAALVWLLSRQNGSQGAMIGLLMIVIALASLVWVGRRQLAYRPYAWAPAIFIAIFGLVATASLKQTSARAETAIVEQASAQKFSETRLADLRQRGVPVFVDFTADWCITCKVNEKIAINTSETEAAFNKAGVVTLVGDWTNEDPEITRFLARHGRNSIPFYLYYAPGKPGKVLPQILSSSYLAGLPQ